MIICDRCSSSLDRKKDEGHKVVDALLCDACYDELKIWVHTQPDTRSTVTKVAGSVADKVFSPFKSKR